jgi:hypothetical protein
MRHPSQSGSFGDDADRLREPRGGKSKWFQEISWHGIVTTTTAVIFLDILLLFTAYPVTNFFTRSQVKTLFTGNINVSGTGLIADLCVSQHLA